MSSFDFAGHNFCGSHSLSNIRRDKLQHQPNKSYISFVPFITIGSGSCGFWWRGWISRVTVDWWFLFPVSWLQTGRGLVRISGVFGICRQCLSGFPVFTVFASLFLWVISRLMLFCCERKILHYIYFIVFVVYKSVDVVLLWEKNITLYLISMTNLIKRTCARCSWEAANVPCYTYPVLAVLLVPAARARLDS